MSDDTPTERFTASTPEDTPLDTVKERKSRKLVIVLVSIGGVLLLAVLIVMVILLMRGNGAPVVLPATPSPSGSPSPTPTVTPAPTQTTVPPPQPPQSPQPPPLPSTDARIDSFSTGTTEVRCNTNAPGGPFPIYLNISWSSSNADRAYFGVDGGDDASAGPLFDNLPPSGDSSNFPSSYYPFVYGCPQVSHKYTLTVIGSNGSKDSRSIIVRNVGDTE